jgi:hypothetical protein
MTTTSEEKLLECEHETCNPRRTFSRPNSLAIHNIAVARSDQQVSDTGFPQDGTSVNEAAEKPFPCVHKECKPRRRYASKTALLKHNRDMRTKEELRKQAANDLLAQGLNPVSGKPLSSNNNPPFAEQVIGPAHVMYGAEVVTRDPHMQDIENVVAGRNSSSSQPPVVVEQSPAPGVVVFVRNGILYVDYEPSDIEEFVRGIRLAIKVTR